ncbi:helix-turn-helix domain-containing protein [Geodermatophilus sp. DSM 44513]|uniref:helix-turn-helix domain-containing protein n=1 Tax=Geodermatophilus sp. DSM 44513 TaxID=1528104 RepID=UPI00128280B3|nr:helix-turn-helix domain-containing protein [Geodermatophilus sp. DSM 44513]WNV77869.1 helix-turn-helix domain-containing protein [Geodermatophilus sp. DSM 44513]
MVARALRRERARTGLSLTELARRAGMAKSTLSQLEAGTGNPSLETLWALSTALDVPFAHLVDPPRTRVQVIRAGEGPAVASERVDYTATLLSASPPRARRDLYLVHAEPDEPRISEPHALGVVEHVVLTSGRALLGPTEDPVELQPGDYVTYPGDAPHLFQALTPGTRAVLLTEHT